MSAARSIDYSRYKTFRITRRGPNDSIIDLQMIAANGKLPTAGHDGHWELTEIWRDVSADDSVRCAVLRGDGLGFSGGGDLALVTDMAFSFLTFPARATRRGSALRAVRPKLRENEETSAET